ncbi:MAG: NAD-dependent epimerase/dehydratase family protein, partial [Candidatus Deferrimicrobium sp.]
SSRSATTPPEHVTELWRIDHCDFKETRSVLNKVRPKTVFHLAGFTSAQRNLELVQRTLNDNLVATVNLLHAASEAGCERVILAGSLEEPDDSGTPASSPYAVSKLSGHAYARMFRNTFGLDFTNARIFMVYGPAQRETYKLVPYVTLSLLRGEVPKLSSGGRKIDWIFVDDVANGLVACATSRAAGGETVDLGSGLLTTVKEVVRKLVDLINPSLQPEYGSIVDRENEQVRRADVARTYSITGWKPSVSLEAGLEQTVSWYSNHLDRKIAT